MSKKSLLDKFNEIYENKDLWDYYSISKKLDISSFDDRIKNSKGFIYKILKVSGKEESVKFKQKYVDLLSDEKAKHTISIFFLGIYLYNESDILKEYIDKQIKELDKKINDNGESIIIEFKYYWFLICFYHDIGSKYEEKYCHLLHNSDSSSISLSCISDFSLKIPEFKENAIPTVYNKIWKKYYKYRLDEGRNDHGIFGGLLFYNDRFLQYENLKKEAEKEPFKHDGVWWSKKIVEEVHAYVAWIIIAHNIWYLSEDDDRYEDKKKKYADFGLKDLILKKGKKSKITLQEYPLLFLLCIVDTIDPVKHCKKNNNILAEIYINYSGGDINIETSTDINIDYKDEKYENKIQQLSEWLDIKYNKSEDYLTLQINNEEEKK